MKIDSPEANRRILIIDDNPSIHEDFRNVLCRRPVRDPAMEATFAILFDEKTESVETPGFELDSAYQGQEGLEMVRQAVETGRPYALAFVDVRMPPGWDGVETVAQLWRLAPELQVVLCTAYTDYSWTSIIKSLRRTDNLVILKKPFDSIEALQLAHALTQKWSLGYQARLQVEDLDRIVFLRTQELRKANENLKAEMGERRSAQVALRASADNLVEIFNNVNVAIFIHGLDGSIVDVNDKVLELYRVDRESAPTFSIQADYSDSRNPLHELPGMWRQVLEGQPLCIEWLARRPGDGSTFPVEVFLRKIVWDGQPAVMATVYDLTEKKSLEKQLMRAQRLESIGTLASGIAHDLNNILAPIMISAQMLQLRLPPGREDEMLTNIQTAAQRGADIVKQVLAFARGIEGERVTLQPLYLIKELEKIIKETFPKNIALSIEVPRDLATITGDPTQMHQVLLNLCVNARDAMPDGGTLRLVAQNTQVVNPELSRRAGTTAGPHILIQVCDTGHGIPPEIAEKIFDPFFTTKEVGKGTGLGLSTVLGIVRNHGGFVDVESTPGNGSSFKVYLPAHSISLPLAENEQKVPPPGGSGECLLVVDDEANIRSALQRMLGEHGYQVRTAANGQEALEVMADHGVGIKAVVTDIMMPIMDGVTLARQIRQLHPHLPVIACTGWGQEGVQNRLREIGVGDFLMKPYPIESLLVALHQHLGPVR